MSYCSQINLRTDDGDGLNQHYHDKVYGRPVVDDNELFERLILEINQAGLNWTLILKKQAAFRCAYDYFNIAKVAAYTEQDRQRLLSNAGIIRHKLKINAAIENAKRIIALQYEYGSFKHWLDAQQPLALSAWVQLFRKTFKFMGTEIVKEFLVSTGYLPGAHDKNCPIYDEILKMKPNWIFWTEAK